MLRFRIGYILPSSGFLFSHSKLYKYIKVLIHIIYLIRLKVFEDSDKDERTWGARGSQTIRRGSHKL
jgi:hypothetical protein